MKTADDDGSPNSKPPSSSWLTEPPAVKPAPFKCCALQAIEARPPQIDPEQPTQADANVLRELQRRMKEQAS